MSRRFRNRHAKVVADPGALPVAAVTMDDSNSYVDVLQPDRRVPLTLNTRAWVRAESSIEPNDYVEVKPGSGEQAPLDRLAAMQAKLKAMTASNLAAENALHAQIQAAGGSAS